MSGLPNADGTNHDILENINDGRDIAVVVTAMKLDDDDDDVNTNSDDDVADAAAAALEPMKPTFRYVRLYIPY
jgi:hypothetical protein